MIKICNIISFIIMLGIFFCIALEGYFKLGFDYRLIFIFPIVPIILFYKIQHETTKKKKDRILFKYKLLDKITNKEN
jgi:hypothetical protein